MVVTCWSSKGGSGTTTVAVALAGMVAAAGEQVTLVDLAGDAPAALGRPEPRQAGLTELLTSPAGLGPALERCSRPDRAGFGLIVRGSGAWPAGCGESLARALASMPGTAVVDAGTITGAPSDNAGPALAVAAASTHSILVVRACYLALRRAVALPIRPSSVVLVRERGRALGPADIEGALGIRVTAQVPWDPEVARAVDAGLLGSRLPDVLTAALRRAA